MKAGAAAGAAPGFQPNAAAARDYAGALEELRRMRDVAAGITAGSIPERLQQASAVFSDQDTGPGARLPGVDALHRVYSQVPTKKVLVSRVPATAMEFYQALPVTGEIVGNFPGSEWVENRKRTMSDAGILYVKKEKMVKGKPRAVYMAVGGPEFIRTLKGRDSNVSMDDRRALLSFAAQVFGTDNTVEAIREFYDENIKSLAKVQRGKVAAATAQATRNGVARSFAQTLEGQADGRIRYKKESKADGMKYGFGFGESIWKTEDGVCEPGRMTYKSGQTLNYSNLRQGRSKRESKLGAGADYEACTFGSMVPDMDKGLSRVAANRFGRAKGSSYDGLLTEAGNDADVARQTRDAHRRLKEAADAYNAAVGHDERFTRSSLAPYRLNESFAAAKLARR